MPIHRTFLALTSSLLTLAACSSDGAAPDQAAGPDGALGGAPATPTPTGTQDPGSVTPPPAPGATGSGGAAPVSTGTGGATPPPAPTATGSGGASTGASGTGGVTTPPVPTSGAGAPPVPTTEPPIEPPAPTPDPECSSGIRNGAGTACCPTTCGSCGGTGCEARPGGGSACCAGAIIESGVSCNDAPAPCALAITQPPVTEPPDPEPPTPPSTGFVPSGAACRLVIDEDFSAYSGAYTTYTQANMMRDFGETLGPYKGLDGRTKVGESSIRAFFPKDTILGQDTGFTWFSVLPGDTEQAIMEYRMKFETGFDWTLGGKLPGFCGGTCPRGCTDDVANGFSMRLMWHRRGEMITYPYWPAQPADQHCGGNWAWSKTVVSGVWYTVRQHLRLNTPGQPNGVIRMYLDGALVQERTDVLFRNAAGIKIDKAYFTTYVGGSTMEFAPDHDQHIWFDSFKVWVGCSA